MNSSEVQEAKTINTAKVKANNFIIFW